MRVLGLLRASPESEAGVPPNPDEVRRMGEFMEEVARAGVLVATDGLTPSSAGARLRLENGKRTVIDGPFAESKELVASYAVLEVGSMDEAIEWCTRFLEVLGGGEVELRPIVSISDFGADVATREVLARDTATREEMARHSGSR